MSKRNQNKSSDQPKVNDFDDYRSFLGAYTRYLKAGPRAVSYRELSRRAGFRSPNFLQQVIDAKRNLAGESIERVAKVLDLNLEQSQYFKNMVLFNQAKTTSDKQFYAGQLIKSRLYQKSNPSGKVQYEYFSNWTLVPIRELVGIDGFRDDPHWIANQLVPAISITQARQSLKKLEKMGLVVRQEDGTLVQTEANISTGDEVSYSAIAHFHKDMIQKGSEAIDRVAETDREISSVTVGVSKESATRIKKSIQKFRKQLMEIAAQDVRSNQVYQINFQLFPLTKEVLPKGGK